MMDWRQTVLDGRGLARLFLRLGDMPQPFTVAVKHGEAREPRSAAQNRTVHLWFAEIAKARGDTSEAEVKAECNLTYGRPIMVRDDPEWSAVFGHLFDALPLDKKVKAIRILDVPFTRRMNVRQLNEYMSQMRQDYAEAGITLTDPDEQKYEVTA